MSTITEINTEAHSVMTFEAPSSGEGFDWVLVVDNADAMFEYPGFSTRIPKVFVEKNSEIISLNHRGSKSHNLMFFT